MLSKYAANIFPIWTGFASEARRVSGKFYRQPSAVDDLVAVDIRYGNLSRWNQVVVCISHFEQVFLEFRQLACPEKAVRIGHEGRQNLLITMFPGVNVQHEIDQRALDSGA